MALNLSTLTSSATSGDVLAEALTTADFLEPVPVLRNLARGSQKGGDAKQDVALNQPRSLPYDGKGYLYLSGVSGNYASVPDPLGSLGDFTMQIDGLNAGAVRPAGLHTLMSQYEGAQLSFILRISAAGEIYLDIVGSAGSEGHGSPGVPENTVGIRVTRVGTLITYWVDTGNGYVSHATDTCLINPLTNTSNELEIGSFATGTSQPLLGKISRAIIWDNGTQAGDPVLDVDFTATNVRHGDTKFKCATGQVVTINQSGNDPSTIIKKSVLRFSTATSGLKGLFANQTNGGYMFAAFSVLGTGGPAGETNGRIFSVNKTGDVDYGNGGAVFSFRMGTTNTLRSYNEVQIIAHDGLYDDTNGDILQQIKITQGSQLSKVNNADLGTTTLTQPVEFDEFNIGQNEDGIRSLGQNAALDLEFLALFPASITDAQADDVRNYINNRNNVFDLKDGFGYYFYDATKAPVGAITTGSSSWNGRIVGSDLGDSDRYLTQGTTNDAPVGDGYVVTFADNTDHLDIPQVTQAGWQVVGTSLGTFAYRVNNTAVTELNLLGNLGQTAYRKAGDLYGIILLPESATGADIEAARSLLIDRGAADGTTSGTIFTFWYNRDDIVEFKHINTSSVTYAAYAWYSCQALEKFPALDLSNSTTLSNAWLGCTELSDFGAIQADSCGDFTYAWRGCSSLTSFPAGAKLGTSAQNVNFSNAWQSSGLTSFSTPLPTATKASSAWTSCSSLTSFSAELPSLNDAYASWKVCSSLTSFNSELPLVTNAINAWHSCSSLESFSTPLPSVTYASYAWYNCQSLESFSSELPSATRVDYAWQNCTSLSDFRTTDIKNCTNFTSAWQGTTALTSFPSDALLGTEANNVNFTEAWRSSGLTSFPSDIDLSKGTTFNNTWRQSGLTSFPDIQSTQNGTTFLNAWYNCANMTSFGNANLDKGGFFQSAWQACYNLEDFPALFTNWNPQSITTGVFNVAWDACNKLTAQSVGNILQSIDASNQHGTVDGTSTGNPLGDSGIDIDYNVATGSLSAATNTAVDSLKAKGWSIIVNNVTL